MIDDNLVNECQKLTGIRTRRALIDYALHEVRRRGRQKRLLQGIGSDADYIKTKEYLGDLIFLPMRHATSVQAAEIYRSLRKKGVTIRKPVDCMIASVAIEYNIKLLHNDRDFNHIAKHSKLRIL